VPHEVLANLVGVDEVSCEIAGKVEPVRRQQVPPARGHEGVDAKLAQQLPVEVTGRRATTASGEQYIYFVMHDDINNRLLIIAIISSRE